MEPLRVRDERELKLHVGEGFRLPELGGTPLGPRVFTSVYHDTPPGSLARTGITLRCRREGATSMWELKLPGDGSPIRLERAGVPSAAPEELTRLLSAHLRHEELAPVAVFVTRRTGVVVATNGARAEVALDHVEVLVGTGVKAAFSEVEVELSNGDGSALRAIGEALVQAGAHRGDEMKPSPDGGWVAAQLDAILAHDPGTRLGADPESLHKHRVAVRRLRAALRDEPHRSELGWIGGALGAVRDLDVLRDHLQVEAARLEPAERRAFRGTLTQIGRRRDRARSELLEALDSPRYFALLDELERLAAGPPEDPAELAALAQRQFRRLRRDVRAAGAAPKDAALHELRKRAKRVRYAAERAGGQLRLVDRARQLQDVLGTLQDTVVTEHWLRELVGERTLPMRALAVGRLIEREFARREAARGAWRAAWRRLERAGKRAWPS